jgi:primosomal protein N' (replication factor Y)
MPEEQRSLFDSEPGPWEEDDQREELVATVVFPTGAPGEFDYTVPDRLRATIEPGRRVRVPLGRGNRIRSGYCVRLETRPVGTRRLKPVHEVVDHRSLLSPSMLRLTQWMADYYLCDWATVLEAVVPSGVRAQAGTRKTTVLSIAPQAAGQLDKPDKLDKLDLPPKQAAVIAALAAASEPMTPGRLAKAADCTQGPITSLRRKGLIVARAERVQSERAAEPAVPREQHLTLNDDQQIALDTILKTLNSRRSKTILIHGVTGSGKTEVYIQAIQEVIRFGRQAIVLVPEISLTPQTVERFRSRLDHVAVLHSHQTAAERNWHWQQIADGGVQVVVGARSAIFAPTPHPRYHARDVAIARAEAENVPLVLGSATPSLESWHRARSGEYALVEMPRRVLDRPMPMVDTIDLRERVHSRHTRGSITRQLHAAIDAALRDDGQVILLLNRRGFSTHIQCPACGNVMTCPHCEIALTHHRTEQIALCHYCDYHVAAPRECPQCRFAGIRYSGQGTQRLEAEVKARFPNVRCLRMDTDTMRVPGSHQRAFDAFRSGDVRILLGTQMIAKGLDFPNVTLVGVINADTALHLPDFRAAERTFQLVTQVAGRTGRGEKGGRVLVQTFSPDHPAIRAAVRHDYADFTASELPIRKQLAYPPFAGMIRLVVRGPTERTTGEFASHVAGQLRAALEPHAPPARVLGPAPAPFAKLRGKYRFQIQVQGPSTEVLREAARRATADLKPPDGVQWIVDVDPLDML